MNNINNFMAFLNWLGKDQQIKLNAYKFYASVSYETNVQQLSFYNKSLKLYISTDSQQIGKVFIPELDENIYFTEFNPRYQIFIFDENKEELIIKSKFPSSYKKYSTYTVTIRNIKKI